MQTFRFYLPAAKYILRPEFYSFVIRIRNKAQQPSATKKGLKDLKNDVLL